MCSKNQKAGHQLRGTQIQNPKYINNHEVSVYIYYWCQSVEQFKLGTKAKSRYRPIQENVWKHDVKLWWLLVIIMQYFLNAMAWWWVADKPK